MTNSHTPLSAPFETAQTFVKRLDGYSYQVHGDQLGLDVEFSGELEIDEKRMAIWVPYADGNRRDGVGDILEVSGIDLGRHRLNPVHMFDHGVVVGLPIGLVEDPETKEYTSVIDYENNSAKDLVFFYRGKGMAGVEKVREYDHALFCEQLYDMLCKRLIRGGSIGYKIIDGKQLESDYRNGMPRGIHIYKCLKLESSSVVMPANPETVRKMLSMPTVCGKRLSPYLVKSLEAHDPGRKAQLGYEGKNLDDSVIRVLGGHARRDLSVSMIASELSRPAEEIRPVLRRLKESGRVRAGFDGNQITYVLTGTKSLGRAEIRQKYRKTKNLRYKTRLSKPGVSLIHVDCKDVDGVHQAAQASGVRVDEVGISGGYHRIRLSGDDIAMDELAKKYGRRVKSMTMDKKPEDDIATLPNDGGPEKEKGEDGEDETLEPYGAQVLRRIHEDHSILMEEYDEMLQVLENQGVNKHLQSILENLETTLSDTEKLFEKEYEDLPKIEGAGEKSDETDATEADSGEEDMPSADEAVEGMRKKYIKALRGIYRRKSLQNGTKGLPIEDGHEPGKEAAAERGTEVKGKSENMAIEGEHVPGKEGFRQEGNSDPVIDPKHRETLDTAAGFVKDLANASDLTMQHRMDAYHYHKLLDPIGDELTEQFKTMYPEMDNQEGAVNVNEPTGQRDVRTDDSAQVKGFDEMETQDGQANVTMGKGWHTAIKGVAGFLSEVATGNAYGDDQRAKAMHWGKMLDGVISQGFAPVEKQDDATNVTAPDGMDGVKSLRDAFAKRSQEMKALREKLASIKF